MIEEYHVPGSACINCGKDIDAASPVGSGRAPQSGDFSICLYCRHLMVYGDDLRVRNLTDEEVIEVAGDPDLVLAMKMLESADQQNEGHNAAQTPPGNRAHRRAHRPR
jgi:hypothetical protein